MNSRDHPVDGGALRYRYRFGAVEFDAVQLELRVAGERIELEQRPLQVLAALLRFPGEVVTREELFESVWAGRPTVDNVLANAVAKLRKALGRDHAARIVTLPRIGYRLEGPIERIASGRSLAGPLDLYVGMTVPGRPNFRLDTPLGAARGGEVWLARHDKTGESRVYKFSADGEHLAALKREATIYRVLRDTLGRRHDFVSILDWNFETTPFYLECEYGGRDLAAWSAGQPGLAALDQHARIELFLRIADAVAAAHDVGVLHKDLKPANVLIADAEGRELRLTDFGSSRLLDPERLEALGITALGLTVTQVVATDTSGTALYLAPELIAGEPPTVQSDLYALGLMLYQLLVGDLRRPLAPGWERAIPDELLREDIAAATDMNRARRLHSVAALAERLRCRAARQTERTTQRESEVRMIEAQHLLEKHRARRPWVAALLLVLTIALGAGAWQYARVRTARNAAQHQAAITDAVNRFLNEDLLGAGVGGSSPAWYERNPSLREILDAAAERLDTRFAGAALERATLHRTLGRAYKSTGDYAQAVAQLQAATDGLQHALGATDERSLLAQYELATTLAHLTRFDEAMVLLERADAAAGERRAATTEVGLQAHLARGAVAYQRMHVDEALPEYQAAARLQPLLHPTNLALSARILLAIAGCELRRDEPRRAEAIARRILAGPPYTQESIGLVQIALAHSHLANALRAQGQYQDAIPIAEQSLREYARSQGASSQGAISQLSSLAHLHALTSDAVGALALQREVYQRSLERWGADSQYTLVELLNLGSSEYDSGDLKSALTHLRAAEKGLTRVSGASSPVTQAARVALANALADLGRDEEALAMIREVDPTAYQATTADPARALVLRAMQARIELHLHRYGAAARLRTAIAAMRDAGVGSGELGVYLEALGEPAT